MKRPILFAFLVLVMPAAFAARPATDEDSAATADIAPAPATPADGVKADKKKLCTRERPMGSNMPRKVCRTVGDIQAEGDASRNLMRDITRNGPSQGPVGTR